MKVAITGVNGGIGRALAAEFKRRGYFIIGLDLKAQGEGDEYHSIDLTDTSRALELYQQIHQSHTDLKLWINNAGIAVLGPLKDQSLSDFERVMKINFHAPVAATHFWIKHMSDGGCVVNMASAAGFIPSGDMSSYVASKHALVGFTRAVQLELLSQGSNVSTCLVAPGFVKTEIMQVGSKYGLPEKINQFATTPEECAREIVSGIIRGEREIIPTMTGKLMTGMYRYLPFGQKLAEKVYLKSREIKEK